MWVDGCVCVCVCVGSKLSRILVFVYPQFQRLAGIMSMISVNSRAESMHILGEFIYVQKVETTFVCLFLKLISLSNQAPGGRLAVLIQ